MTMQAYADEMVHAAPSEKTRDELVGDYWRLLKEPAATVGGAALRQAARENLADLGALPSDRGLPRRKTRIVSVHFRARWPKRRLKRFAAV